MLYSENGKQDPLFITNYAIINVLDVLSRHPGSDRRACSARSITRCAYGSTPTARQFATDPGRCHRGDPGAECRGAGRPDRRTPDRQRTAISVERADQGRLTTPEQFGNIVLRANPDGSLLRVHDVARVDLGAQNQDVEGRLNSEPAVAIGIYLSPGANAVDAAAAVKANLDRLSQRFPPGLKYLVNYDTTTSSRLRSTTC